MTMRSVRGGAKKRLPCANDLGTPFANGQSAGNLCSDLPRHRFVKTERHRSAKGADRSAQPPYLSSSSIQNNRCASTIPPSVRTTVRQPSRAGPEACPRYIGQGARPPLQTAVGFGPGDRAAAPAGPHWTGRGFLSTLPSIRPESPRARRGGSDH